MIAHTRHSDPLQLDLSSTPIADIAFAAGAVTPASEETASRIHADVGRYRLRLAATAEDREAACRLRFKVFNIELGEGLESSYHTGLDVDRFDTVCEHLLVEDKSSRRVVGTYRMQSGETAAQCLG
ncbi:MAG: GNAT family N-acetyltransferase, partial [Terracidiphilus sp.]